MKMIDVLKRALVGRTLTHKNRYNREVALQIEDIVFEKHSYDLEPATQANDWWPATSESSNFLIKFTDGSTLEVSPDTELNLNL